jgi:hypothetical protein
MDSILECIVSGARGFLLLCPIVVDAITPHVTKALINLVNP